MDDELSDRMRLFREIASLGRSARMEAKLKVRQPLAKVEVILADAGQQAWLEAHDTLLRDELNVKKIEYTAEAEQYITYPVPNFQAARAAVRKTPARRQTGLPTADAEPRCCGN